MQEFIAHSLFRIDRPIKCPPVIRSNGRFLLAFSVAFCAFIENLSTQNDVKGRTVMQPVYETTETLGNFLSH